MGHEFIPSSANRDLEGLCSTVIVSSEHDLGVDVDAMDIKEVEQKKTREEEKEHSSSESNWLKLWLVCCQIFLCIYRKGTGQR